jgi:hypothetical protein
VVAVGWDWWSGATRVFSDEELAQLRGFGEIGRRSCSSFHSSCLLIGRLWIPVVDTARGSPGLAVQLCTLPWLGFVPDDVAAGTGGQPPHPPPAAR